MTIKGLGYNSALEDYRKENNLDSFDVGRVISEHKERYVVRAENGELDSELIGNLRFTATSRADFPAVGDWVAISEYDEGKALIHHLFPRSSVIERHAVGKPGQTQIIATNIDVGLIVQSVNRDFNLNRLERYLTICNSAGVSPIIVLSKIDLITQSELNGILSEIDTRLKGVQTITISNQIKNGYESLFTEIKMGSTYCLLGSSGVGKSTIVNNISGGNQMKTGAISSSVNKGKHVTSHRELVLLDNGGILIDNPGMREVGITDSAHGLEVTFDSIFELSQDCRFKDCTHTHESGCAILEAIENEEIDQDSYENYLKMEKEKSHYESSSLERKQKDKDLGKMIKNNKKGRKHNKF